jgi:ankyrin repeat protein
MAASYRGREEIVKLLLDAKADVNCVNGVSDKNDIA